MASENASPLKMAVEESPLSLLMRRPRPLIEIGESVSLRREPSAGYSEGLCKAQERGGGGYGGETPQHRLGGGQRGQGVSLGACAGPLGNTTALPQGRKRRGRPSDAHRGGLLPRRGSPLGDRPARGQRGAVVGALVGERPEGDLRPWPHRGPLDRRLPWGV